MLYYKKEQGGRDTSDEMSKLRRGFQGAVLRLLRHGAEQEGAEGEKKAGSSPGPATHRARRRLDYRTPVSFQRVMGLEPGVELNRTLERDRQEPCGHCSKGYDADGQGAGRDDGDRENDCAARAGLARKAHPEGRHGRFQRNGHAV